MPKLINASNMTKLALDIIDYLASKQLWDTCGIYVNNAFYCDKQYANPSDEKMVTSKNTVYYKRDIDDIKAQLEFSNPETISLIFEGPLYSKINYDDFDFVEKLTHKFLDKYGLYFEQGYAWSMAAYQS
jgi:hypothetical protein